MCLKVLRGPHLFPLVSPQNHLASVLTAPYAVARMADRPPVEHGQGDPRLAEIAALEDEIASLPEVRAVRVVATAAGRITEVHLISEGRKSPKQLVRDVQTLAQAHFGLEVDHRVVSVVQFGAEVATLGAQPRLAALSWSTEGGRATCRVRMQTGDETHIGETSGPATSIGRHRLAAQATTQALSALGPPRPVADVADIDFREVGEQRLAIAVVILLFEDGDESIEVGSAIVRGDEGEAVVRAILEAYNRGA